MGQPVITLLSDLGMRDASAAIVRTALQGALPGAFIIDITHSVKHFDTRQAAYLLYSAWRHFQPGTIHIALVDILADRQPKIVVAEKDGHFFIAPDTGLLPMLFGDEQYQSGVWHILSSPHSLSGWIAAVGEVTQTLSQSGFPSLPTSAIRHAQPLLQPRPITGGLECEVLFIDRFGNIVLGISKEQLEANSQQRPFRITLRQLPDITAISTAYSDVPVGEPLCRFNSCGLLEIALNHDNAAELLGFGPGHISIRRPTVSIFFQ